MLSWTAVSRSAVRQVVVGLTLMVLAFVGLEVTVFLLSALSVD